MSTEIPNYSLTRQSDDTLLDEDGVTWSSVGAWFFIDILGGCGCGTSEELSNKAIELLTAIGTEPRDYNQFSIKYNDSFWELLMHWFDSAGLTEHGTSVFGAWLTEKGKKVYQAIDSVK